MFFIGVQKKFSDLQILDLLNCEVADVDGFREKVFALLENLVYLDGMDREDKEAEEDDEDDLDDDDDLDGWFLNLYPIKCLTTFWIEAYYVYLSCPGNDTFWDLFSVNKVRFFLL